MFDWIKSFFSKPEVADVVDAAGDVVKTTADAAIDRQVEYASDQLKKKINATNMAVRDKAAINALLNSLVAVVKSTYGDRK